MEVAWCTWTNKHLLFFYLSPVRFERVFNSIAARTAFVLSTLKAVLLSTDRPLMDATIFTCMEGLKVILPV
jgi:hypothetical protein